MQREEIEKAIEEIHPACFGWALTCCRWNREEAEEVLQTSYLKVLGGKIAFNGHSSIRTWMFGIVRKTASERRRYNIVRLLGLLRLHDRHRSPEPGRTPETAASDRESHETLRALLELLPRRQRDVLHLVYYQEMTIEEASKVLGISLGTARTHYERGKARLRILLSKAGIP